ncbi:L-ribulose-5-phosphate 3-epimerase [Vagococcus fluvialis]|uniref:L-ribulose-5-phosphate 3-epimerase n=1 Tax=Vagococcus fluvialis TaxID=2738 RepID=UPI0037A80A21
MAQVGIYEKALPQGISWEERLKLAKDLGFDFIEMSIDETDERLSRLDMSMNEIDDIRNKSNELGIRINSICLSGHRRYPFGSSNTHKRDKAKMLLEKAIIFAHRLGVPIIQIAGYDVYYEDKSMLSRERFIEGMRDGVKLASQYGVILSIEIMDDPFMNSIQKFLEIKEQIPSPYLQVYPDLGNLSAWLTNNPGYELELGIDSITSIHLKDTFPVTNDFSGQFREVPFGEGCVDFSGLLCTLYRLGYDGTFLIEMWSEKSDQFINEINEAKNYLYPKMREAGYNV